ncbi:MAG: sensor domain-containing protein [Chloroflexi bacterium]|jgi:hypothetical protein|nr:sensor domain-containing protein [Chloroflexota bacterium]MBT3670990.1 sensor domain-containing protein [Chloroflexota bacterium]MBT4003195.1 sensor domain-containing protein [Chloroflexota bacterium]MBT4305023.1 sensor domain-containing protein [Chloroflexota bacterium]MBT4533834.1 sensor domain-containing protein [Chloroflexota bacterium]
MSKLIKQYLTLLKRELTGTDRATIQDAQSDAEEHLNMALQSELEKYPDKSPEDLLPKIIEEYGSPEETAAAYTQIEARIRPALSYSNQTGGGGFSRFFGIFADPKAWGALVYMLISLVTGPLYFTWAVAGLSTSFAFALFIFGLPVAVIFMFSVKGISLLEGRIVEGLLGVRMPRRQVFFPQGLNWKERIKVLFKDKSIWMAILYMVLMLPLGVIYFTLSFSLNIISIALMITPFLQEILNIPLITFSGASYFLPNWLLPAVMIIGLLLLTGSMHLAKLLGGWHGKLAKFFLVAE